MKRDLQPTDDIELLVDTFYGKVHNDDLLGPIFNEALQEEWPVHLNKMYNFWHTVLLDDPLYFGNPFLPHVDLPNGKHYFDHWLKLFHSTLDQLFEGEKTEETKRQVNRMTEMFHHTITAFPKNNKTTWR